MEHESIRMTRAVVLLMASRVVARSQPELSARPISRSATSSALGSAMCEAGGLSGDAVDRLEFIFTKNKKPLDLCKCRFKGFTARFDGGSHAPTAKAVSGDYRASARVVKAPSLRLPLDRTDNLN